MKVRHAAATIAFALTGTAGTAHAVALNPKGLGQVLIYPYYTVNKDQDTLVSVVNTTNIGKAIEVRFLEGYNGREVHTLKLYLSPHDVWAARIGQLADDGGAAVFTADHSCTYPAIDAGGKAFLASAYAGGGAYPADGGPTSIMRTREGSVEMIEIGEIIPGSPLDIATTHVQNGQPNDGAPACPQAAIGGSDVMDLSVPRGGLSGTGSIVNVAEGTFFGYAASALSGFSDQVLFAHSIDLGVANSAESQAGGAVAYLSNDAGAPLALDYARGIDAVSAVLMADSISNDFLVASDLGANTDWIVTFPTKRFYVDPYFTGSGALAPFAEGFGQYVAGQSNVDVGFNLFDQEEGAPLRTTDVVTPSALPYTVNAISFLASDDPNAGTTSGVLGSKLIRNVEPYGAAGWMSLDLASGDGGHALTADRSGIALQGLPAIGFMVYNVINANAAPGKLANYGGALAHRSSIACSSTTAGSATAAQDPCS